jgi:large subunit ribosomal protein L24
MKIHKNDTVLVITGKDRGKKGRVRRAFPKEEKVLVEGANMIKRHLRAQRGMRQAGVIEREAPLHIAKVMLICPKCNQPVRIGFCFLEDGRKARICRSCQEVID